MNLCVPEPGDQDVRCRGELNLTGNRLRSSPPIRLIIDQAVAQVFAISTVDLSRQTRGKAKVALARQVAMYLAHVACGLTFTEIGQLFGRDRTTVAHACVVVEDRRDEKMFDVVMELLECAVTSMLGHRNHEAWITQSLDRSVR